jgi:GTP cyclohydrolase I
MMDHDIVDRDSLERAEAFDTAWVYHFDTLKKAGVDMRANSNLMDGLPDHTGIGTDAHIQRVALAVQRLLKELYIDVPNDHNTVGTARRVAKMYVTEVMKGRFQPQPDITAFPNAMRLDELYTVGPLTVRSLCSHHLAPVIGRAWIGVIPGEDSVIGLSKFARLVDWVFSRPQIQEEATIQLADIIMERANPKGLAVVVKASHMCMTWRGVKEPGDSVMTTSVVRGAIKDDAAARAEFFSLIREA